jgi:signal transduction histidine kinase
MKAPGRAQALDLSLALIGVVLTAVAVWSVNVIATPFAGPTWLKVIWPLLIGAPLALRRRAPLLGWTIVWAGISLQALITGNSPEGVELMFVLGVGSYSVAAYSTLRRALTGLAVTAVGCLIYGQANHDIMSGNTGNEWSAAFFATAILAAWLAGVFVRSRREAVAQAARTAAAERQAERAVADERARMARELHDIVSHNLSVVVLQAAGAQAAGSSDTGPTLEKIERSGRQALVEMRRLLGVLRQPDEPAAGPELSPQPGMAELAALAEGVRAAGLPVVLVIDGDPGRLPAAVDISAYRIVQEALTNVLKHAGQASAQVSVRCGADEVLIEVTDDGDGPQAARPTGGHGLAGMRERVALFGGELTAGPKSDGGFAVRARLLLGDQPRPAWPLP